MMGFIQLLKWLCAYYKLRGLQGFIYTQTQKRSVTDKDAKKQWRESLTPCQAGPQYPHTDSKVLSDILWATKELDFMEARVPFKCKSLTIFCSGSWKQFLGSVWKAATNPGVKKASVHVLYSILASHHGRLFHMFWKTKLAQNDINPYVAYFILVLPNITTMSPSTDRIVCTILTVKSHNAMTHWMSAFQQVWENLSHHLFTCYLWPFYLFFFFPLKDSSPISCVLFCSSA